MVDKKATQRVRILHNRVGAFDRGRIVGTDELENHEMLASQGAIEYVDDEALADEQRQWSLYNVNRSQSPPTLPNAPFVTESQHEVQVAAGMVPPETGTVHPGGASYVGPDELRNPPKKSR